MKKLGAVGVAAVVLAILVGLSGIQAQNAPSAPAVKRNVVLKQDMTIPGREAVMAWVEIPVGGAEGKHTHPAEVYVFVLEGTILQEIAGKPDATLKAGDFFYVAPGQVHQATNKGTVPVKLAAVFVAEKGKPLTTKAE
jgi:quercetin dioxygenase-like cupin family protein